MSRADNSSSAVLNILPTHVPTNADGVPILRSSRDGRRMRYMLVPLAQQPDPPSSAAGGAAVRAQPLGPAETEIRSVAVNDSKSSSANLLHAQAPRQARCAVCTLIMKQPVSMPCGHAMCSQCQPSPEADNTIRCPTCNHTWMATALKPAPMISWLLKGIRVKCLAPGCQHECDRSSIEAHSATCGFVQVSCPHEHMGCSTKVARSGLAAHLGSCPFQACQSFMASTLRRLQAIEEDNRQLRVELVTLRASVRWVEITHPIQCADCSVLFIPDEDGGRSSDGTAENECDHHSTPEPSAVMLDTEVVERIATRSQGERSTDPRTLFQPWPTHRAPPSVASTPSTAGGQEIHTKCSHSSCKRHRRDDDWYAEWRQRKCRFLLAATSPQQAPFTKMPL